MTKFKIEDLKQGKIDIPEENGFYVFRNGETVVYAGKSANLQQTINQLLAVTEKPQSEVQETSDSISWEVMDNMFQALLKEKSFMQANPDYQAPFRVHDIYKYMGIDFHKVPYFKFEDATLENHYYLGPFPSRFFLFDFLDCMMQQFHFPFCESDNYPCEKMNGKLCKGYCLEDNPVLAEVLRNNYLRIPQENLSKLKNEARVLSVDLEFEKAAEIGDRLTIFDKFYDYLKFLHVTKKLELEFEEAGVNYKVHKGILAKVIKGDQEMFYPVPTMEYRNLEHLAVDKSELAERRIIYNFLKDKFPQQIDEWYNQSCLELEGMGV